MIVSWGDKKGKQLHAFFYRGVARGLPKDHLNRIARQLDALDAAVIVTDMDKPGWGLHQLKGRRKGYWSIKVNGPWRITFQFENGRAHIVDYEQYH
ncbi:MAG: type II toxin-antitoxin system RelE/ParE family toxin [Halieaceae bacterium]|nr:type II toxin-antitoxin system RelE/ParE family toxin [Halieaceae bacterium]